MNGARRNLGTARQSDGLIAGKAEAEHVVLNQPELVMREFSQGIDTP